MKKVYLKGQYLSLYGKRYGYFLFSVEILRKGLRSDLYHVKLIKSRKYPLSLYSGSKILYYIYVGYLIMVGFINIENPNRWIWERHRSHSLEYPPSILRSLSI